MSDPITFMAHEAMVMCVRFNADGQYLISAGMDNVINLWSVPSWERVTTFEGHANSVNRLAFSPDQQWLASSSTDATLKIWAFPSGELHRTLEGHKKTTTGVAVSSNGKYLASASYDTTVRLFGFPGGDPLATLKGHPKNVTQVAFSPDSRYLISGGLGDEAVVWSVPEGEVLARLPGHEIAVSMVRFTSKPEITTLSYGGLWRTWTVDGWQETSRLQLDATGIAQLTPAPDGKTLAAAINHNVVIYDAATGHRLETRPVKPKGVYTVAYSPDGRFLACGAADKRIRVWTLG
ncbi:MAG: WD40 repeat domain-containing protein [Anaerolineae bacterium]|nr:WD40 repeat domain-containing protein [Anaerolineae bacterium]